MNYALKLEENIENLINSVVDTPKYQSGSKGKSIDNYINNNYQTELDKVGVKVVEYKQNGNDMIRFCETRKGKGNRFVSRKNVMKRITAFYTIQDDTVDYTTNDIARKEFDPVKISDELNQTIKEQLDLEKRCLNNTGLINKVKRNDAIKKPQEKKPKSKPKYSSEAYNKSLSIKEFKARQREKYAQAIELFNKEQLIDPYQAKKIAEESKSLTEDYVNKANGTINKIEKEYKNALKTNPNKAEAIAFKYFPENMLETGFGVINLTKYVKRLTQNLKIATPDQKNRIENELNGLLNWDENIIRKYDQPTINDYLTARNLAAKNQQVVLNEFISEKPKAQIKDELLYLTTAFEKSLANLNKPKTTTPKNIDGAKNATKPKIDSWFTSTSLGKDDLAAVSVLNFSNALNDEWFENEEGSETTAKPPCDLDDWYDNQTDTEFSEQLKLLNQDVDFSEDDYLTGVQKYQESGSVESKVELFDTTRQVLAPGNFIGLIEEEPVNISRFRILGQRFKGRVKEFFSN
ncbi:hypothetical protein HOK51_00545 [Candidatus Woesearchaeota archaeon]|jgi:hypothetical protein|nr:hypothetical protein [Candidatus Woesearchaeota archaeon]MBT6518302.1 hypothetical protein [Candidatus Woesearchaeota archaeon]MBT7367085.1 hypothetical protein [Candidatus Woesearchaeota archaeon]